MSEDQSGNRKHFRLDLGDPDSKRTRNDATWKRYRNILADSVHRERDDPFSGWCRSGIFEDEEVWPHLRNGQFPSAHTQGHPHHRGLTG